MDKDLQAQKLLADALEQAANNLVNNHGSACLGGVSFLRDTARQLRDYTANNICVAMPRVEFATKWTAGA